MTAPLVDADFPDLPKKDDLPELLARSGIPDVRDGLGRPWRRTIQKWQIEGLLAALEDSSPNVRYLAAKKLAELLSTEAEFRASLPRRWSNVAVYRDVNWALTFDAASHGPLWSNSASRQSADRAIPYLIPLLEDYTTADFARAVGRLSGRESAPSLMRLLELDDDDPELRIAAMRALGEMGYLDAKSKILQIIDQEDDPAVRWTSAPPVRIVAAEVLGQLGETEKSVSSLLSLIDWWSRTEEADDIDHTVPGPDSGHINSRSVEDLHEKWRRDQIFQLEIFQLEREQARASRIAAIKILVRTQGLTRDMKDRVARKILEILEWDTSEDFIHAAVEALSRIGDQESLLAALNRISRRDDLDLRLISAEAFMRVGDEERALPELTRLLKHPSPDLRVKAAGALGKFRDTARAYSALVEREKDDNLSVRTGVAMALGRLGKVDDAVDMFVRLLDDSDSHHATIAAEALGYLPTGKARSAPILRTKLGDEDLGLRIASAEALGRLAAVEEAFDLEELLEGRDQEARIAAALALGHMGWKDRAASILSQIFTDPEQGIPLPRFLQHRSHDPRFDALEELGPHSVGTIARILGMAYCDTIRPEHASTRTTSAVETSGLRHSVASSADLRVPRPFPQAGMRRSRS